MKRKPWDSNTYSMLRKLFIAMFILDAKFSDQKDKAAPPVVLRLCGWSCLRYHCHVWITTGWTSPVCTPKMIGWFFSDSECVFLFSPCPSCCDSSFLSPVSVHDLFLLFALDGCLTALQRTWLTHFSGSKQKRCSKCVKINVRNTKKWWSQVSIVYH